MRELMHRYDDSGQAASLADAAANRAAANKKRSDLAAAGDAAALDEESSSAGAISPASPPHLPRISPCIALRISPRISPASPSFAGLRRPSPTFADLR